MEEFKSPFEDEGAEVGGSIDDERVYSAPFEDESLAESEDDENLGATQEALEAEREERDTAASEEEPRLWGPIWNADTSFLAAQRAMGVLFDMLLVQTDVLKGLFSAGLSREVNNTPVKLDGIQVQLVIAGLQLLGFYFPELRDEIVRLFDSIELSKPTEEEAEQIHAAFEELQRREAEEIEAALRGAGFDAINSDDLERLQVENDDADGSFGGLNMS